MRWALVGVIVAANACSDLLNTSGMRRHGVVHELGPRAVGRLMARRNPYVIGGTVAGAVAFFALIGQLFLGEYISLLRWGGIVLITGGVLMVSRTTPRTHHAPTVIHPPSEVHIALGVGQE